MNLSVLHRRPMQDVLEIGNSLPLVITGGYVVQAHRARRSQAGYEGCELEGRFTASLSSLRGISIR
jgi:hypothetical protein